MMLPKTYNVRWSTVLGLKADVPVLTETTVPAINGWPGWSDEVVLQPGEFLAVVDHGDADSWSVAIKMHKPVVTLKGQAHV